jgi:outer membrane protein assembly factor BamB
LKDQSTLPRKLVPLSSPFLTFVFSCFSSLCFLCLCGESLFLSAGDWPQFRGPEGSSVSEETNLPIRWSQIENVRWKVNLPGRGVSCPVIAGDKVYVTACSEFQQTRLHVLCYQAVSGKKLWERQFWATANTMCNDKTCMAAPTPVTDGERVYALFACGDLVALDSNGDLLWYRSLGRDYPALGNNVGMVASPVLCKEVLILPMVNPGDSFIAGLDKHSGRNLWKSEQSRDLNWVTPLVINANGTNEVLFQSPNGLIACDPETGRLHWSFTEQKLSGVPSPVKGNGLLLVAAGGVIALRPGTENRPASLAWQSGKLASGYSSPLFYDGRVYAVNTAGVLNYADSVNGKRLWQERLKGKTNQYWASPVIADGKLYAVDEGGTTTVVRVGANPIILAANSLDENILATPAISGGAIYLRSDQHLYCIAEKRE